MLLLAFLLAAQAAQDDPEKLYGDWAVACDNLHRCEMTSLLPGDQAIPEEGSDYDATMSVIREAGPAGGFTVEVWPADKPSGKATLRIDDVAIASAPAGDEGVTFKGADAARIAAAMPNGKALALVGGDGKVAARISLAGSSASLRHIDADQGRAGTVTALVARGARPAGAVPAAKAAERIVALRPSGAAIAVSRAMRLTLEKQSDCDGLYDGAESVPEVETHALGGGKTLALLPCGAGAYNYSTVAFVIAGGKAVRAVFDDGNDGMLVNAGFDKGELSTYAKGRGIGDCGDSASYVWDGTRFRLTRARSMSECRGSTNWLTTYRATPVFR
ncbi:DUF1176 domain-containing protein [Sphingomonas sp. Sphisp140]|uniref:DUF1176 domain-containing protein n=1 Tax=unclassified Sphingomonas TaxID=196159 RepID=UPI0039B0E3B6